VTELPCLERRRHFSSPFSRHIEVEIYLINGILKRNSKEKEPNGIFMKSIVTAILVLVSIPVILTAQEPTIRFKQISIVQGLSVSTVLSILQDEQGFMWIGTEKGLNKFDGYSFFIYKADPEKPYSLSNSNINNMLIDKAGNFWIGTKEGLNLFDRNSDRFRSYAYNKDDSMSLSCNLVYSICEGVRGHLWVGTEHGLNDFNSATGKFIRYRGNSSSATGLNNDCVHAVLEDGSGIVWIGTNGGGLNRFDPVTRSFDHYKNVPRDKMSLSDNTIFALYLDHLGVLWVGTRNGLNAFDRLSGRCVRFKNNPANPNSISDNCILCIKEDNSGKIWIGTENGGLSRYEPEVNRFVSFKHNPNNPQTISMNTVEAICEDNAGGLWFGVNGGGINLYYKESQKFMLYQCEPNNPNSLSDKLIRQIIEDSKGDLWICTQGGGLNRLDRKTGNYSHYRHDPKNPRSLSDDQVMSICEDRQGGVYWIGTYGGGLNRLDRSTGRFTCFRNDPARPFSISNDKIRVVMEDYSGNLWIGTDGGGIDKYDRANSRFIRYRSDPAMLGSERISAITEDHGGFLWIGTLGGGLQCFNPENGGFTCYTKDARNPGSISDNFILSVFEDHAGTIWAGSAYYGLNQFNRKTKTFTHFTRKDGLPDEVIYDIREDRLNNLWMSTDKGICRFNPSSGVFRAYDVFDGLQSNEFNTGAAFKSRTGEMFFGGIEGFNSFFPDSIQDNPYIPRIAITSFQLFNKPVGIGPMPDGRTILQTPVYKTKTLNLTYKDNVFSFEFSALNFNSPEKNCYAYKMEGFEKKWNFVGNRRFVTYTGLPPGKYNFRVKGSNNDNVWNEKGVSLAIRISPPVWRTWWFYTIYVILLLLILTGLGAYIINLLNRNKEESQRRRTIRTFSQALEQGKAAVYRRIFDSNVYEFMGRGIKDITGYDHEEMTPELWDRNILSIENKGSGGRIKAGDAVRLMKSGKINRWVADTKIKTKDGLVKWVMEMATILRDGTRRPYGMLGTIFDITDRKRAEQELAETTELLKNKNEEMQADLNMARDVQLAFLAKNPLFFPRDATVDSCNLQFAYRYVPAAMLAGDFFSIQLLPDKTVGVLICDVMGHGARASLLTAYLQGLVEELRPVASDVHTFMRKLNTGFHEMVSHHKGMFSTAFYLVADVKNRRIQYANAGHPAPLLIRGSGPSLELTLDTKPAHEPALGLRADYVYSATERELENDDIILFYTDGVYEAENLKGQLFKRRKFLDLLVNRWHGDADELLDGVLREVMDFTQTREFKDDVCIVSMLAKNLQ
jgi:PAS domain S-box-containing protein